MRRLAVLAFVLGCGQPTYVATGDVIAVDPAALEVTIRHEDIPGLMGAMTMPFHLRSADVLAGIRPAKPVGHAPDLEPPVHLVRMLPAHTKKNPFAQKRSPHDAWRTTSTTPPDRYC